MKKFVFAVSMFLMAAVPAFAQMKVDVGVPGLKGRTCYMPEEAEAEEGIKIHSELMVIALNCQHMTPKGWKNFYQQYREITARNADLIGGYENVLINYFALAGASNPEVSFHNMRTSFANQVSTDAAKMRPDIFCATYAPRLPKVDRMSTADLKGWAKSASADGVSRPLCH